VLFYLVSASRLKFEENFILERTAIAPIASQNNNFNFVFGQFASLVCSGNPFLRIIPERSGGKILGKDCSGKREKAPN